MILFLIGGIAPVTWGFSSPLRTEYNRLVTLYICPTLGHSFRAGAYVHEKVFSRRVTNSSQATPFPCAPQRAHLRIRSTYRLGSIFAIVSRTYEIAVTIALRSKRTSIRIAEIAASHFKSTSEREIVDGGSRNIEIVRGRNSTP